MGRNRAVDLIDERIDLGLRVRSSFTSDAALTMRSLGASTRILVASPQIASQIGSMEQLARFPALATNDTADEIEWHLEMEDGHKHVLRVEPHFGCEDMAAVRDAAMAGLGIAILPDHVCLEAIEAGRMVRVLPAWRGLQGIVHLFFTTRRGLPPASAR